MTEKKQEKKATMKEKVNTDFLLNGGLGSEKEHGSDETFFGMLYPLELTMGG